MQVHIIFVILKTSYEHWFWKCKSYQYYKFRAFQSTCINMFRVQIIWNEINQPIKRFELTFAAISRESCRTRTDVLRSGRRTWSVTGSAIYTRVWVAGGVSACKMAKRVLIYVDVYWVCIFSAPISKQQQGNKSFLTSEFF